MAVYIEGNLCFMTIITNIIKLLYNAYHKDNTVLLLLTERATDPKCDLLQTMTTRHIGHVLYGRLLPRDALTVTIIIIG